MKKYKITEEQVKEEAGKFNMIINDEHFIAPEETKRGRPKSDKALTEQKKEKGAKGRPKKTQISLEIEGDDMNSEEVAKVNFKELVRETIESSEELTQKSNTKNKPAKSEEEKEAEKSEKEAKRLAEKAEKEAEKEAKRLAEKAEKEAKRLAEKAEKEAKLAAEKEEKAAKKKADEEARAAKKAAEEAEKQAKKEAKSSKKSSDKSSDEKEEATPEPDVVRKIEFEGKKYLKSKNTGIVYDYLKYTQEGEQVVVGKWSDATNSIMFDDHDSSDEENNEEQEEVYDM
jgi:hypothetical protein